MTEETLAQNGTKFTSDQENYIEWLTLPVSLRVPKTKTDYSEQLKIPRRTLYNWENLPGFDEERRDRIKKWQKGSTPEIVEKLKEKAMTGDVTAIRTWLEWVEGIENKMKIEHSGENIKIIFYDADKDRKTEKVPAEATASS